MRKRLIIGTVAAVAIGIAAWILRPWETRIEYHIRKYQQTERELAGKRTVLQRAWQEIRPLLGYRIPPQTVFDMMNPPALAVWKTHEQALLNLGYLERREFPLTNRAWRECWKTLPELARKELPKDRLWRISMHSTTTNVIVIQAERHDMAEWERMIREIDVP